MLPNFKCVSLNDFQNNVRFLLMIPTYIKDILHVDDFFYSLCPNLEGVKDVLCNNF